VGVNAETNFGKNPYKIFIHFKPLSNHCKQQLFNFEADLNE
jgi:hypothetical protein